MMCDIPSNVLLAEEFAWWRREMVYKEGRYGRS